MNESDLFIPEYITTGKLARLGGYHPASVWLHIKKGKLKAIQFEERSWYVIHRDEAYRWLKKYKKTPSKRSG